MAVTEHRLADRLGMTVHISPLRYRLERLRLEFPSATAKHLEDWLVDVANARGARVVMRPVSPPDGFRPPPESRLRNEDLVVGICQLQCLDRPQMLRLAGQLISRRAVEPARLCLLATRERVGSVLAALAREALRVEPGHELWRALLHEFQNEPVPRDVLLHWTRLAEPVMRSGAPNAQAWKLAA